MTLFMGRREYISLGLISPLAMGCRGVWWHWRVWYWA